MSRLVGVDETGRGSCIGRLYVAAAIVDPDRVDRTLVMDSKKLKGKRLMEAYHHVKAIATAYIVQWAEHDEVDTHNPTQATVRAWHRCLDGLDPAAYDEIIVDGIYFKPYTDPTGIPRTHRCEPKADANHVCVSAASILAKVERDRYVLDLCAQHPELKQYGVHTNMGYPSKAHRDAIKTLGKTPWHRQSYNIK